MALTRRDLLGSGLAAFAGASLPRRLDQLQKRPKNIIFCVSDGMADQVPSIADTYQQLVLGHRSYWAELMDREDCVMARQDTRSLSSVVTDSAAASSTWGSGRRIWNGMLNMYPDKTKLRTLTEIMTEAGVACGLVTTTTATHATPAGFAVQNVHRGNESQIADSYVAAGVQVLMGGGNRFFDPAKRADKVDGYGLFRTRGFDVFRARVELKPGSKVLGIFSDSHVPYTIDRANDPKLAETVPTLAEMTASAIASLKGGKNGFLLQIEGGKVDHACHANDVTGMLFDQIAFEEAVKVAVDFALADGETLVIITADHATGGPSLNGDGNEYFDSTAGLASLSKAKASVTRVLDVLGKEPDRTKVKDTAHDLLGIDLADDEADSIAGIQKGETPFKIANFYNSKSSAISAVLGDHYKITWTSGNHTSENVMVSAIGPGSELIRGVVPNTKFFDIMLGLKGLKHENPRMSYEEAFKLKKGSETQLEDNHWS